MEETRERYTYQYYLKYSTSPKKYLDEALEVYSLESENLSFINQVAYCYYYCNDFFNALDFVLKGLNLSEHHKKFEEYYYTLSLAGDIYRKLGISESSIFYYMEALKNPMEQEAKKKRCDLLRKMAMVYIDIRAIDMAMDYGIEALQLSELLDDETLIGNANLVLCRISMARRLYDKALKYGLKSLEVFKDIDYQKGLVLVYLEIASIYERMNNGSLSKEFYERALNLAGDIQYNEDQIYGNYLLGRLLLKERQSEQALQVLESALNVARKYNIQKHKVELYYAMAEAYSDIEEFELAYNAYKTWTELQQYFTAESNKEKIYRLQNEYNLYIKERELAEYVEQYQSLERVNKQLSQEVQCDALTSLLNRRGLKKTFNNLEFNGRHILILSDIDDFKQINDQYGHPCGDEILKQLSEILKESLQKGYRVARWGGEEFLIVLPDTTMENALSYIYDLRERIINTTFYYKDMQLKITMTFGLAPLMGEFDSSINLADQRLYKGKKEGKNQAVFS
jgi:diguanylate cyclase (GGDEF)-like protein